ncbi:MAG: AraC family transcriptional regulator [Lachnospiraceae bacterium]|nr:AraC family transcriptional regulator [Lachnospiraceae bacterium]
MNIQEYENYHENRPLVAEDFHFDTYLCSIPLDFSSVPLHWHDELELIYIKKGMGTVSVDFVDYDVSAGDLVLVFPGSLHEIKQVKDFSFEYENIMIGPDILESAKDDPCMAKYISPILDGRIRVPAIVRKDLENYKELITPIDNCDNIRRTMPEGFELYLKGQMFLFFYGLYSTYKKEPASSSEKKSFLRVKQILKYVELHYSEHLTIKTVADVLNLSESHFMKFFKDTMGVSFIDYLKDYRLKMAARMLRVSDDPILHIAEDVGFDNLSYFNRSFKSKYGETPSKYRKR